MSWITVIWSIGVGLCLGLSGVHTLIWFQQRRVWASLAFAVTAVAVASFAFLELWMMHARQPDVWGLYLRWTHLSSFLVIAGSVIFIQIHLGTGRLWLGLLTVALRFCAVAINFSSPVNVNYREIHSLQFIPFLGEQVAIPGEVVVNPWMSLAQFSLLLWLIFVVDAALRLWRRGQPDGRRRALVVGGGTALFIAIAISQAILVLRGLIQAPLMPSLSFQFMVLALGYELSRDVLQAARLASELRISERRLSLAASASRTVLWEWQAGQDAVWASSGGRSLYGVPPNQPLSFEHFSSVVHPDDRAELLATIHHAVEHNGAFTSEYRVVQPDDSLRWIAGSGTAEHDPATNTTLLRGVSVDVTERRKVDDEIQRQRGELAHLSRVASLGELSGSLAHEINQPLAIILSNAQAAQRLLAQDPPDVAEVREIITDIINADRRAGEVIKRLRALLKHGESERRPLALQDITDEVLALMRSDFIARGVHITQEKAGSTAQISGDHIALQQVWLNLFTNACDAMAGNPPETRRLTIETRIAAPVVQVSICDTGCGLPPDAGRIFEPFFTTKSHGLGMGLSICRTIVAAHGGRLWAEASSGGGSTFHLELPLAGAAS